LLDACISDLKGYDNMVNIPYLSNKNPNIPHPMTTKKNASGGDRNHVPPRLEPGTNGIPPRPPWQRILLLIVLGYEGAGALAGGILLIIAPDGKLMDMPVDIMNGIFRDFLIPGLILFGLGVLNTAAFVTVLIRARSGWFLSALGLGGLVIWFITEIAILRELHWLHAMWGIPVLVGCLVAFPLVSAHFATQHRPTEIE
jgi:hypothetical protein